MSANIKQLQELDEAIKAMDTLSDKDYLGILAENVTADIIKVDYATGRLMEYMAARVRRIAESLPQVG
jgi:hypothetical protein